MLLSASPIQQRGLTLIEMLIASVLGLFVTAVILTVFATNVRSNTENLKMVRMNQELRAVMNFMADELRRHGYSADNTNSDFMDNFNYDSGSNCLRYAYDENSDGALTNSERHAFHLNGSVISWRTSVTNNDCSDGTPEGITIADIAQINTMQIDLTGSSNTSGASGVTAVTTNSGLSIYELSITLVGEIDLPHTTTPVKRTVQETIRLRNETPKPN